MRRRFLHMPQRPHQAGHRLVPVTNCGCVTCVAARTAKENAADEAHYGKVGDILGLSGDDSTFDLPQEEPLNGPERRTTTKDRRTDHRHADNRTAAR